jgi:Ankyrin repeats (3 copies)
LLQRSSSDSSNENEGKKVQEQQNYFFQSKSTSAPASTIPQSASASAGAAANGQCATHICRPSSQHDHNRERSQSLTVQQQPNTRFLPTPKITTLPAAVTTDALLPTDRLLSPEVLGMHDSPTGYRDVCSLCKHNLEPLNFDYAGPEFSSSSMSSFSCFCGRSSSAEWSSSVLPPPPVGVELRSHSSSNSGDFRTDDHRFPDEGLKAICNQVSVGLSGPDNNNHSCHLTPHSSHRANKEDAIFVNDSQLDSGSAFRTDHADVRNNSSRQLAVLETKKTDPANESPTSAPGECWKPLLHIAVENGRDVIVQILLEQGIEIDERDSNGLTALHHAVRHKHETVLQILLQNGADANACDNCGWTPIHQAAASGYEAGVRLLLLYGVNLKLKAKEKEKG